MLTVSLKKREMVNTLKDVFHAGEERQSYSDSPDNIHKLKCTVTTTDLNPRIEESFLT